MDGERARTRVLVYGASGVRGTPVARRLLDAGWAVRVLARSEAKAAPWRRRGAEVAVGDLADRASLERASAGVDAVFLHLPLVYDRSVAAGYVRNAVAAARAAGVGRLVFQGNNVYPAAPTEAAGFEIDRDAVETVLGAGIPSLALRPTVYMDNLLGPWTAPGIVDGGVVAYPIPAAEPVAWVSADDAAAVVGAALERTDLTGVFDLGGPELLTGDDVAARFAAHLGRPVRYQPIPLDAFEAGIKAAIGDEAGTEVAKLYRWDAERGDGRRNAVDPSPLVAELPVRLTTLAEWIERQEWAGAAVPLVPAGAER